MAVFYVSFNRIYFEYVFCLNDKHPVLIFLHTCLLFAAVPTDEAPTKFRGMFSDHDNKHP